MSLLKIISAQKYLYAGQLIKRNTKRLIYVLLGIVSASLFGLTMAAGLGDANATLVNDSQAVTIGAPIAYHWSSSAGSAEQDWIGLCRVNEPNSACITATYTQGRENGSGSILAPVIPGQYELRYFLNNSLVMQSRSNIIAVNDASILSLNSKAVANIGSQEITVHWQALAADVTSTSWIGLYAVGAPNSPSIKWAYTNAQFTGDWSTVAPSTAGKYEFRYFSDNGYKMVAKSSEFTVNAANSTNELSVNTLATSIAGTLSVDWRVASGNANAWIGLYKVGSADSAYLKWTYTLGQVEGRFTTNIDSAGQYEFRYFSTGYTKTATSSAIVVADRSRLALDSVVVAPNSTINVSWKIPLSEWTSGAWTGLFALGANDASPLQWMPVSTLNGKVGFNAPGGPGNYEIRYFSETGKRKATSLLIHDANLTIDSARSKIKNLIVIMQENHSFDSYFGQYCTAPTGSNPVCSTGAGCCEAGPSSTPGASAITALTDAENIAYDPPHSYSCEISAANLAANSLGGFHGVLYDSVAFKMDRYAQSGACSNAKNFAYAPPSSTRYQEWAQRYAIADHFFQSVSGASEANDMYFAGGRFVFFDNQNGPAAIGEYGDARQNVSLFEPNIADILLRNNVSFGTFIEGYDNAVAVSPRAPASIEPGCAASSWPCVYDAGDVPFSYYASVKDDKSLFRDFAQFAQRIASGSLPAVSYVRSLGVRSEHGGAGSISAGTDFIQKIVNAIQQSATYSGQTLILIAPDESGGFFDHVSPPPKSFVDHVAYGPRTDFVAIGKAGVLVNPATVAHTVMEPASILRFIEWNWAGGATGQLNARDATSNNIGALLMPELGVPQR